MSLHRKKKLRHLLGHSVLHIFFIVLCFATLVPILYALSVSLNAENSLLSSDFRFIPKQFTLDNYKAVFTEQSVMLWFKNSMILAVCTVIISLGAAIPAAYVFSRKRFAGRGAILEILLLLYSFPSVLSMFAIYKLLSPLGLVNSRIGLILVYTGTMAVFGLWNMKGYFDTIPIEIEEAASIDGMNAYGTFLKIILPLSKPIMATMFLFYIVGIWNNWFGPFLYLDTKGKWPVALYLRQIIMGATGTAEIGAVSDEASQISANVRSCCMVLTAAPIICVYPFVQKYFVQGMMIGSVKG